MATRPGASRTAAKRRLLIYLGLAKPKRHPRIAESVEASQIADQRERIMSWSWSWYSAAFLGHWLLPASAFWHALEILVFAIAVMLYAAAIRLRLREHRAAGLPTDPLTLARSSIALEGVVLIVSVILVAAFVTAAR